MLTGKQLTEKEFAAMVNHGTVPDNANSIINYYGIRDFIIDACIKQEKVKKVSDLKDHKFLKDTFFNFSSFMYGKNTNLSVLCQDVIHKEPILADDFTHIDKIQKGYLISEQPDSILHGTKDELQVYEQK